jgi:hypothetical protein
MKSKLLKEFDGQIQLVGCSPPSPLPCPPAREMLITVLKDTLCVISCIKADN